MAESNTQAAASCNYKNGILPACAPLAVPFVPYQQNDPKLYTATEGLNRGTMFPGLFLPLKNIETVSDAAAGALGELMALAFSIVDLGEYLDTHADDMATLQKYTEQVTKYNAALAAYVAKYGPIVQTQVTAAGYTWLKNPWPWDFGEGGK